MLNTKNMKEIEVIEEILKEMGINYQNEDEVIYIGFQNSDENIRFATRIYIDNDSEVFLTTTVETVYIDENTIIGSVFRKHESKLFYYCIKRDYCNFTLGFKIEHTLFMLPYALGSVIHDIVSDLTD